MIKEFKEWLCEDESREVTAHYASSASACRRKLYYDLTHEPKTEELTAENYLKFKFGHSAEYILGDFLRSIKDDTKLYSKTVSAVYEEVPLRADVEELDLQVSMRVDFIIEFTDGTKRGIELKSTFGRGIINQEKDGKPKDDHLLQVLTYQSFGFDMPFSIVYMGRDNGLMKEYEILNDEEGLRAVDCFSGAVHHYDTSKYSRSNLIKKFREIETAVDSKSIPDRQFKAAISYGELKPKFTANKVDYKSDWQCSYCSYFKTCYKDILNKQGKWYGEEKIV